MALANDVDADGATPVLAGRFDYNAVPQSPRLRRRTEQLRISASMGGVERGQRKLKLHVSYLVPEEVEQGCSDFNHRFFIVVHDATSHRGFSLRTVNRERRPPASSECSLPLSPFHPRAEPRASDASQTGGWINAVLLLPRSPARGSSLVYVYVVTQNYVSNTLAIDGRSRRIRSFEDSFRLGRQPDALGITLETESRRFSFLAQTPLLARGTCRVRKRAGRDAGAILRGLSLTAISAASGLAQTVFPTESQVVVESLKEDRGQQVLRFRADLRRLLNFATTTDFSWHVHAACFEHVSGVLQLDVTP